MFAQTSLALAAAAFEMTRDSAQGRRAGQAP